MYMIDFGELFKRTLHKELICRNLGYKYVCICLGNIISNINTQHFVVAKNASSIYNLKFQQGGNGEDHIWAYIAANGLDNQIKSLIVLTDGYFQTKNQAYQSVV